MVLLSSHPQAAIAGLVRFGMTRAAACRRGGLRPPATGTPSDIVAVAMRARAARPYKRLTDQHALDQEVTPS